VTLKTQSSHVYQLSQNHIMTRNSDTLKQGLVHKFLERRVFANSAWTMGWMYQCQWGVHP